MITEYCLFADESRRTGSLFLGGLICTKQGAARLKKRLYQLRGDFGISREMKWTKASKRYCSGYEAWLDVFLTDPSARYSVLHLNQSSKEWHQFNPNTARKPSTDSKISSAYHQFLVTTFGRLSDTKRWSVYPDQGLFKSERKWQSVEFLFNRTYRSLFGSKSSRIIRFVESQDSHDEDLLQLSDMILGIVGALALNQTPTAPCKNSLAGRLRDSNKDDPHTKRGLPKILLRPWINPDAFNYIDARSDQPWVPP